MGKSDNNTAGASGEKAIAAKPVKGKHLTDKKGKKAPKKDKNGAPIIRTNERIEVEVLVDKGAWKKGEKKKMHPLTAESLENKGFVKVLKKKAE